MSDDGQSHANDADAQKAQVEGADNPEVKLVEEALEMTADDIVVDEDEKDEDNYREEGDNDGILDDIKAELTLLKALEDGLDQDHYAQMAEEDDRDEFREQSLTKLPAQGSYKGEESIDGDQTAQYAQVSVEDQEVGLTESESDQPTKVDVPDGQDRTYEDDPGRYATPVSPDTTVVQEHERPAQLLANDAPDDVPHRVGPTYPSVPSPPALFTDDDVYRKELRTPSRESTVSNVLNLVWSFGQNRSIPVVNLTTNQTKAILYVCAHTGLIFDFATNRQTVLQGHSNDISCTCVSVNKRWIVTADKGNDSLVIIWDSSNGVPVKTIFDAHADGGVAAVALTFDARYLATLSAAKTQTLAIWDWTTEAEIPLCTAELLPSFGEQNYISFYQDDLTQLTTNSENQVLFYSWKGGVLEYFAPPLTDDDFNKPVGRFNQTVYLSGSSRALTSTSIGNIVIWDTNKQAATKSIEKVADKRALKIVRTQDSAINVLTWTDKYIVTGDNHGHIRFFDQSLQLVNWYNDFQLGAINAISFAYSEEFDASETKGSKYPSDATIKALPFVVRDFIIGTNAAVHAYVSVDGTDVKIINQDFDGAVQALATHPSLPIIAAGSHTGLLKLWQYKKRSVIVSRLFDRGQSIRSCIFDPDGHVLAIGFGSGVIRLVDALSLEDISPQPLRFTNDAISHVAFSHDSQYLATADAGFAVSVFKKTNNLSQPFEILGRYRSHYRPIKEICFGIKLDSNAPRLLSLGQDRFLVEYDLETSSQDNLCILSSDRVEQSAVPLCMMWYPPITKESFILMANDQFKFKLYNSTTKMCRKTILSPTYGSPLQKIVAIPAQRESEKKRYLAYSIKDKIGLIILPLDGNPHNSSAVIAHPRGVSNIAVTNDGLYLFTSGGPDASIHMWTINLQALEVQARLGGEDLIPFYGLLEGGREGAVFHELEDLFYYAQIRSQGIDAEDTREVTDTIAISEIPFVVRALGFYPTEQEIEEMLNEVKFGNYVETGEMMTTIDLGNLIKLYVNHRPAFGLDIGKLRWAFKVLGFKKDNSHAINRGHLLNLLQECGEHLTEEELADHLSTLLGFNPEGGSCEREDLEIEAFDNVLEKCLPEEVTVEMFVEDLLGFQNCPPVTMDKETDRTSRPAPA